MINLLLILLVFHYIGYFIFGDKTNTFNCGIFAWAGKSPKKFDKQKFNVLGIFNDERGGHSCGVGIDGDIFTGIKDEKLFKKFIATSNYDVPKEFPTVIGHTRKATYGSHTIENAHPFGFGNIKRSKNDLIYKFIGVHNGTLLNYKEIAHHYKVKPFARIAKDKEREKIDSEILLEAIYKNRSWKVLEEYNGAAALVFQDLAEPNVIYCYHGASKKERNDKDLPKYIERPLFYWKETRNSLYISSMEESLIAIGGDDKSIGEFQTNTIYKITDGNVEKAEKTVIDRPSNFINKTYGFSSNYHLKKEEQNSLEFESTKDIVPYKGGHSGPFDQGNLNNLTGNLDYMNDIINGYNDVNEYTILKEKGYMPSLKNKVVFNKLRYWQNTKLAQGIYTFIPGFGFYYLGLSLKEAEEHFWVCTNKFFYQGEFVFDKSIQFIKEDMATIPFTAEKVTNPNLFYFYRGINVEALEDYNILMTNKIKTFSIKDLSHCSVHPVVDLNKSNDAEAQNILYKGNLVNDVICPLGSEKIYTIEGGNCTFYESSKSFIKKSKSSSKVVRLDTFKKVTNELVKHERQIEDQEQNNKVNSKDNDIIENLIDEVFKGPLLKFPEHIKRLEKYNDNADAVNASSILEDFLMSARQVMDVEPKQ